MSKHTERSMYRQAHPNGVPARSSGASRGKRALVVGTGITALALGGIVLANPANAHVPGATASCDGIVVNATKYSPQNTNTVKVSLDGKVLDSESFGMAFGHTYPVPQDALVHSYVVAFTAITPSGESLSDGTQKFDGNVGPCGTPPAPPLKVLITPKPIFTGGDCDSPVVHFTYASVEGVAFSPMSGDIQPNSSVPVTYTALAGYTFFNGIENIPSITAHPRNGFNPATANCPTASPTPPASTTPPMDTPPASTTPPASSSAPTTSAPAPVVPPMVPVTPTTPASQPVVVVPTPPTKPVKPTPAPKPIKPVISQPVTPTTPASQPVAYVAPPSAAAHTGQTGLPTWEFGLFGLGLAGIMLSTRRRVFAFARSIGRHTS